MSVTTAIKECVPQETQLSFWKPCSYICCKKPCPPGYYRASCGCQCIKITKCSKKCKPSMKNCKPCEPSVPITPIPDIKPKNETK